MFRRASFCESVFNQPIAAEVRCDFLQPPIPETRPVTRTTLASNLFMISPMNPMDVENYRCLERALTEVGGRNGVRGPIGGHRPHALHHPLRAIRDQSRPGGAVDQLHYPLFGFVVVPGSEGDGPGFVR